VSKKESEHLGRISVSKEWLSRGGEKEKRTELRILSSLWGLGNLKG
jgi:hypothetical protein